VYSASFSIARTGRVGDDRVSRPKNASRAAKRRIMTCILLSKNIDDALDEKRALYLYGSRCALVIKSAQREP
jgi:hypothetical protein